MLLCIDKLKKSYGAGTALDCISLEMGAGEVLAFLGPNGAGKTTAISILTGLIRQDSGDIYYGGELFNPDNGAHKRTIGVVPQHNNIDRDLDVRMNLKVHGLLYGMRGSFLDRRIGEVLALTELASQANKLANELSGGMKRRLVIARALLHKPKLLYLDEPSAGLDPKSRRDLHTLIYKLNANEGVSIFCTTHYIEEADALAGRVIFLDSGRIVADAAPAELKADIGKFAVESISGGVPAYKYFAEYDEARTYMASLSANGATMRIREVSLEDAFINKTGKNV
ncbi:ATP-binding cassette domain-containing protein [Deferribacterales bacterium RsTz2092]|nr:ABC transporter ATP-binding protein [Deferribacterales bacterium]